MRPWSQTLSMRDRYGTCAEQNAGWETSIPVSITATITPVPLAPTPPTVSTPVGFAACHRPSVPMFATVVARARSSTAAVSRCGVAGVPALIRTTSGKSVTAPRSLQRSVPTASPWSLQAVSKPAATTASRSPSKARTTEMADGRSGSPAASR